MALWICRLPTHECNSWDEGLLDSKALEHGIGGWLVPITVGSDGSIPWQPAHQRLRKLPYALELQLTAALTPRQEQLLVEQLRPHVLSPDALKLLGRPVMLLKGLEHMASLMFSLRRWRQGCPNVLLLGNSDERNQLADREVTALDGWVDVVATEANYLRYLKRTHHRLGRGGLEIPAVQALTAEQDQHCLNGSAGHYREWLAQACAWSTVMHNGSSDGLVLIDSWEGHQSWGKPQPTGKDAPGLQNDVPFRSLRDSVVIREWGTPNQSHIALLLHAFYPEQMEQMLQPLARNQVSHGHNIELYVSTPIAKLDLVSHILEQQGWPTVKLFGVENCGRDLVPFLLHLLPAAQHNGHNLFIKAHTKASLHLKEQSRQSWSRHLTESLLTPNSIELIQEQIHTNPSLGLLAPAGCLMPISLTLHKNYENLIKLLHQSSMQGEWLLQQQFIAGSMFAGRLEALKFVQQGLIDTLCGEKEAGQTDGTISHALERWLSLIAIQNGWDIREMQYRGEAVVPGFGYQIIQ